MPEVRVAAGCATPAPAPAARSAPCTAAPMAPAQVPSSASTTSMRSTGVVMTRRRISALMGSMMRSPALDQPPPRMMRSGVSTVMALAMPMPR